MIGGCGKKPPPEGGLAPVDPFGDPHEHPGRFRAFHFPFAAEKIVLQGLQGLLPRVQPGLTEFLQDPEEHHTKIVVDDGSLPPLQEVILEVMEIFGLFRK